MSITKLCLRLVIFLCTLTVALFVTRLFLIPPRVEVRVAVPAPPPAVDVAPESAKVNFKVQQVVLDRARGEALVQLSVEQDPHAPAPRHLLFGMWLDTSSNASPDKFGQLGCGIAGVPQSPLQGERATLTAVFHCGASPDELTNNYYAHIVPVQPTNNNSLRRYTYAESDVSPAIPVVIEHGLKRR